jgi:hypothetical protein
MGTPISVELGDQFERSTVSAAGLPVIDSVSMAEKKATAVLGGN